MTHARLILCVAAIAALVMSATAFDMPEKKPIEYDEYKHSDLVVDGLVKSLAYLTEDGKPIKTKGAKGPRYQMGLTVTIVHNQKAPTKKASESKKIEVKKGEVVTIDGRRTNGKEEGKGEVVYPVPEVNNSVLAFLKFKEGRYTPVEPKSGLLVRGTGRGKTNEAPTSPAPKKDK
jgi:hypothetical protein